MTIGITTKINLLFSGILLLLGVVLGSYSLQYQHRSGIAEMNDHAAILLNSLGISCEYPLLVGNQETIHQLVQNTLKQKNVVYCRIEGKNGIPAVQSGTFGTGRAVKEYSFEVRISRSGPGTNEDILLGTTEEIQEQIGRITLGISLDALARQFRRIRNIMIGVLLLTLALGSLASFLLLRPTLSRPVAQLVEGTRRIARGELGHHVPVQSNDEMGLLAESFNKMTDDLQKVTVSKGYVDNIIQSMTHMLIVLNAELKIQTVNASVLDTLGYAENELMGQPIDRVLEKPSATDPAFNELLAKGYLRNAEKTVRTKSGTIIPTLFSGAVMRDAQGALQGIICVAQDIADHKRLEAMMLQSEKMSAVGQLAAGVAHEINNPLGTILGFVQAMQGDMAPDSPLLFPAKSIEREAIRCKNLVQDLLTFSRASQATREATDLNTIVLGALSLVQTKANLVKIEIRKDLAPALPAVLANPNQIQQVVINLASNALDAMPDGGVLTIQTLRADDDPGCRVGLKIIDTGFGIPTDVLPRIFEPFFTTKPVGQGTGLGLSLVYEIIQKHGGTIEVQSRPGHTEFFMKFPTVHEPASPTDPPKV